MYRRSPMTPTHRIIVALCGRVARAGTILLCGFAFGSARGALPRWDSFGIFTSATGRTQVPCIKPGGGTVLVIAGQSNAANSSDVKTIGRSPKVKNLNIYDDRCYIATDPLLGASGNGGSFATVLGRMLSARTGGEVTLVPIAI